ncbi:hypothetical protein HDU86_004879 [Geranomyces michiganensis]|nr:hypothetical protein HDU86_004879 [Geranomyces michiganensis]
MSSLNTGLTPGSRLQPWQRSVHIPGAQSFPAGITHEIAWSNFYQRRDPDDDDADEDHDQRYQNHRHAAGICRPHEPFTLTMNIARPSAPTDHLPSYANGDGEVPAGQHGPLSKLPGLGIGGWVGMGLVSSSGFQDERNDGHAAASGSRAGYEPKIGPTLPSVRRPQTGVRRCLKFHLDDQKRPASVPLPSLSEIHTHTQQHWSTQHLPYINDGPISQTITYTSAFTISAPPQRCGLYAPTQLQHVGYSSNQDAIQPEGPFHGPDIERIPDSTPFPPVTTQARAGNAPRHFPISGAPQSQYRHAPLVPKLLAARPVPLYVHETHYDRRLLKTCYQTDFGPTDDGGLTVRGQGVDGRYRKSKVVHTVPPWAAGPSKKMTMRTGADHLCTFATGIAPCSNFNNRLHL